MKVILWQGARPTIQVRVRSPWPTSPALLAFDEITAPEDVEAVSLCAHCGTAVLASAHAADVDDLCRRPLYRALLELHVFERAVVITREEGKRRYRMEKMEGNLCSS